MRMRSPITVLPLILYKTVFDVSNSEEECSNTTDCSLPLTFFSQQHVVRLLFVFIIRTSNLYANESNPQNKVWCKCVNLMLRRVASLKYLCCQFGVKFTSALHLGSRYTCPCFSDEISFKIATDILIFWICLICGRFLVFYADKS